MATNIDGLGGFNPSPNTNSGNPVLIAAYGNDLVNVDTGLGYGQNIAFGNKAEFENFLDRLFFENGTNTPRTFNGSAWGNTHINTMPIARYIKRWRNRIYLLDVTIGGTRYPSRVWFCDLPKNNTIQWGLQTGTNLSTTAGSTEVWSANAGFKTYGIKVGDPFLITSGSDQGQYIVESVDSDQNLNLTQQLKTTATGVSYWTGSNFFDVNTDDGDIGTWIDENSDRLIVFKNNSLHRYDESSLKQVKGVPGTTSGRSVKNVLDKFTIYFHGSLGSRTGFYVYDGVSVAKISGPVEKHIAGIPSASFDDVVAWTEGELYRAWVGSITNNNHNISLTNVVFTYDVLTNTWSIDPLGKQILCSTQLRESNQRNTYLGDSAASVFQAGLDTLYAYDTTDIPFEINTHPRYPAGPEETNTLIRVQVIARNARGVAFYYKLYNDTNGKVDDKWFLLGEIKEDKTEFIFPSNHNRASGYQYRLSQTSTREPQMLIEKISTFYRQEGFPRK